MYFESFLDDLYYLLQMHMLCKVVRLNHVGSNDQGERLYVLGTVTVVYFLNIWLNHGFRAPEYGLAVNDFFPQDLSHQELTGRPE